MLYLRVHALPPPLLPLLLRDLNCKLPSTVQPVYHYASSKPRKLLHCFCVHLSHFFWVVLRLEEIIITMIKIGRFITHRRTYLYCSECTLGPSNEILPKIVRAERAGCA